MIRYFCDRCDDQADKLIAVAVDGDHENSLNHSICKKCWAQLKDFFKPLPKDATASR